MKKILSLVLVSLAAFTSCQSTKANESKVEKAAVRTDKPNVIVIYTDDQGAGDMACYGAKDAVTPNMDKLAADGTRFTQYYVASPVCVPSRAALLTGTFPHRAGAPQNTSPVEGKDGMPNDRYTMAELFKDNGYKTAHIGKWHLGMSEATDPMSQGFDYTMGHLHGCIDNWSHYFYWNGANRHDLFENRKEIFKEGTYFPDFMEEKAEKFIEDNKDEPFFMYYAINMPHYPYQPTQKWREYYRKAGVKMPRLDYLAFISSIDDNLGKLRNHLEKLGLAENTIIIYSADNGHSTESRAFGGGGSAGVYRGAKFSLFEGGIRLPSMISWKGHLPTGVVSDQFITNMDWLPTLKTLAGLKVDNQGKYDGNDIAATLKDPNVKVERTSNIWRVGRQAAVRKGDWKLMINPNDTSHKATLTKDDKFFLVNVAQDPTEMTNVAKQHPELVKELTQMYLDWEFSSKKDVNSPYKGVVVENKH